MNFTYKLIIIISLGTFLSSLASCIVGPRTYPDFDMGITTSTKNWKLPIDSFHTITPLIGTDQSEDEAQKILLEKVLRYQNEIFSSVTYHDINFPKQEEGFEVSSLLEIPRYYKHEKPDRKVPASDHLLVDDKKYGLQFQIATCSPDYNFLRAALIVINNDDQTMHKVSIITKRARYPLKDKLLFRVLDKLVNESIEMH